MKGELKFALWLGAFYGGIVVLIAAIAGLVATGLEEGEQRVLRQILGERAPMLAFLALILLFACGGLLRWLFVRYVTSARALAEQTRIVVAWQTS